MNKDQKIKAAMEALQESVREMRTLIKEEPETQLSDLRVRGWLLATDIHLEHLDILLHDLQPTLF